MGIAIYAFHLNTPYCFNIDLNREDEKYQINIALRKIRTLHLNDRTISGYCQDNNFSFKINRKEYHKLSIHLKFNNGEFSCFYIKANTLGNINSHSDLTESAKKKIEASLEQDFNDIDFNEYFNILLARLYPKSKNCILYPCKNLTLSSVLFLCSLIIVIFKKLTYYPTRLSGSILSRK